MNNDDFEKRLERQLLRKVPSAWRLEILRAAREAAPGRYAGPVTRHSWLTIFSHSLASFLWPHPKAWAGLTAIWLAILAVNFTTADKAVITAKNIPASSSAALKGLQLQEQLLAELNKQPETSEAERPKVIPPRPHSQRREEMFSA